MRYVKRGICLLAVIQLMSVFVFAAPYVEEFSAPLPSTYCSVYNLIPLEDNVGRTLEIEQIDDDTMYMLTPESDKGGVIIYASGVQSVRVGFYSYYGIYAVYSAATGNYRQTSSVLSGITKRMRVDHTTQTMCVQDENQLYSMYYNDKPPFGYVLSLNSHVNSGASYYPYLGANIYVSQDNVSYLPLGSRVVTYKTGSDISTDESTAYCELEAAVPAGYRYIKVEMNRPTQTYIDATFTERTPVNQAFAVYLSRITLGGDAVRVLSNQQSSSTPSSSSQASSSSTESRSSNSRTADTATSTQPENNIVVGDIDGFGYQLPSVPRQQQTEGVNQDVITNEVLDAETSVTNETDPVTKNGVVYEMDDAMNSEKKTAAPSTDNDIMEIVCLVIGAVGVASITYVITSSRVGGKGQRQEESNNSNTDSIN